MLRFSRATTPLALELQPNQQRAMIQKLIVLQRALDGFGDADGAPADVSIPTLYDVYLKPWKAYVIAYIRHVSLLAPW
jgi:hypothetical protein|eukprot:COSAG02_NODE_4547_length_5227_cov_54.893721_6_plen_78_part_00